jgi:pantothenate kinase
MRLKNLESNAMRAPVIPTIYLERLRTLLGSGQRTLLGLAGPPGCGKSTLAQALQQHFPAVSVIVPMDGYHLANVELARLGRAERKGAPDTFDSAGYVALLRRLRQQLADETVYAPLYTRELEEGIAGAIPIAASAQLVITEGNYLLMDQGHWGQLTSLLDEVWYVEVDEALRLDRLTARHQQFGRSLDDAQAWVATTDEPNARLIEATRSRAHRVFRWGAS